MMPPSRIRRQCSHASVEVTAPVMSKWPAASVSGVARRQTDQHDAIGTLMKRPTARDPAVSIPRHQSDAPLLRDAVCPTARCARTSLKLICKRRASRAQRLPPHSLHARQPAARMRLGKSSHQRRESEQAIPLRRPTTSEDVASSGPRSRRRRKQGVGVLHQDRPVDEK